MEQKNYQMSFSDILLITYDNNKVFDSMSKFDICQYVSIVKAAMIPIIVINRDFWVVYEPYSDRYQTSGIGEAVRCP